MFVSGQASEAAYLARITVCRVTETLFIEYQYEWLYELGSYSEAESGIGYMLNQSEWVQQVLWWMVNKSSKREARSGWPAVLASWWWILL